MAKGITKQLETALNNVSREIADSAAHGGYAAALSSEGYAGGYRQALYDVSAALRGVPPNHSRFWPRPNEDSP